MLFAIFIRHYYMTHKYVNYNPGQDSASGLTNLSSILASDDLVAKEAEWLVRQQVSK